MQKSGSAVAVTVAVVVAVLAGVGLAQDAARPAGGQGSVMAVVNGQPIYMSQLNHLLVEAYGMPLAQQLIATELVRQEAAAKGITASAKDIEDETQRSLDEMFPGIEKPEDRAGLLTRLMQQQNMTKPMWDLTMLRNVLLRKLAEPNVKITDEQVAAEFDEQYGRRVVIRHVQLASAGEAQKILDLARAGADFAQLAAKHSKNPSGSGGGLLPPIGKLAPGLPPPIRDAALKLKNVGDIAGPVVVGTTFHVIKLEEIIARQNVELPAVRAKIEADLHKRLSRSVQQTLLVEMLRRATAQDRVRFVDPTLKSQADEATRAAAENYTGKPSGK